MAEPLHRPNPRPAKGALRATLIAVALEFFATRPYEAVTVADIAQAAGVAHGLMFHYFDSKRGLYLSALKQAADELVIAHQTDPYAPAGTQIRQLLRSHLAHLAANEHVAQNLILRGAGNDTQAYQALEPNRREMSNWVCAQLHLDPDRPTTQTALRWFARATDEATAEWLAASRPIEIDVVVEGVIELLIGALQAAAKWDPDLVVAHAVKGLSQSDEPSPEAHGTMSTFARRVRT